MGSNPTLSALFLIAILVVAGCRSRLREFEQKRVLLGTVVKIRILAEDEEKANRAMDVAFLEIEKVDSLMSRYNKRSELSKLNTTGCSQNEELIEVISECKRWGKLTDGAFDVTITPLLKLWDFKNEKIPEADELSSVLELVDYRRISVSDSSVQIERGSEIDLGGAAKGYAVDRAVEKLKGLGIQHALVDAGGDMRAIGGKEGKPWRIGVKHPRKDGIVRLIELWDGSVTTSGDYERYFIRDGVRYHHIVDPRTGYPARGCVSVTILAKRAMEADILATGVAVLGRDAGVKLIESLENVGALIISDSPRGLLMDEVGRLGNERGQILQD